MRYSLFEEGYRFDFFQAVRLLERLYPDREPVGREAHPSREVARFGARVTLEFPASQIQEITPADDGSGPSRMTVNFMGLTGPLGVLPHSYTELLFQRLLQKDFTLRDFFDLFNHRAISLFFRAWEKYHFPIAYERRRDDSFSQYLSDLIGIGTPGLKGRLSIHDETLYFYTGLFNQRPRSACGLEGIVRDYYEVPTKVEQFVGRWVRLGEENHTLLAVQNTVLGESAILGERIWDRQSKFRHKIGAIPLKIFRRLLPCGDGFESLVQLTQLYAGLEYDFDVELVLKAQEVPLCPLLSEGEEGAHLGWSSWLKVGDFASDRADTVLECNERTLEIARSYRKSRAMQEPQIEKDDRHTTASAVDSDEEID